MNKRILTFLLLLISALALTACSDSGKSQQSNNFSSDHKDYSMYRFEDLVDDEGHTNRTYYYINQTDSFELTFRVNRNHTSDDFFCGTAIISNDALNYMRYSLIDTKGTTIVGYDTYAYFNRIDYTPYFYFTSKTEGDITYGIFDETGKVIIEEKYLSITRYPAEDQIFFACMTGDNTYDICKEDGSILFENVTITDVEASAYYNRFENEGKGLFALVNGSKTTLMSESSGETLATVDSSNCNTLPDYYISNEATGSFEMFVINDNNDAVISLGADYGNNHCYSIKGYRYVYNDDNYITGIFDANGNLKDQPENVLFTKLQIADTYSLLLEYEDKYILKDSTNKELNKFEKSSYSILAIEEFGIAFEKADKTYLYNLSGTVIVQDFEYNDSYTLSDGKYLVPIPGTGTVIISDVCDGYVTTIHNQYLLLQDPELTKYQIFDDKHMVVFEFPAESFESYVSGTGYDFIVLSDGIYTPTGKKIEVEGLN